MGNADSSQSNISNKAWLIAILSLFIPGAGHLVQRRFGRGAILSSCVIFCFCIGIYLGGQIASPFVNDPSSAFVLQILKLFSNIGNGLIYVVCLVAGIGQNYDSKSAEVFTFEYGNHFILISGLLNYLITLDAFDIFVGRKE